MLPAYNEEKYIRAGGRGLPRPRRRRRSHRRRQQLARPDGREARPTRARVVTRDAAGLRLRAAARPAGGHGRHHHPGRAGRHVHRPRRPEAARLRGRLRHGVRHADDARAVWDQANMGWFLRIGNWTVAKLIQFLYGGPSLSDCGCTLRLTHRARARSDPRRPDRRRIALPARDGDPGAQAATDKSSKCRSTIAAGSASRRSPATLKGTLHDGLQHDRPHPQVPARVTVSRSGEPRRQPTCCAAALVVCLARRAALPLHARRLLRPRRLRRRPAAGAASPPATFRVVRDVVDGRDLGLHRRTKSVRSRRCPISSRRSAARRRRSCTTLLNIALHAANGAAGARDRRASSSG